MIRRSFFKLALGVMGVLGLPKPLMAAVDREAKILEHRKRLAFMDSARPIIRERLVITRQDAFYDGLGHHGMRPDLYYFQGTFRSSVPGAQQAMACIGVSLKLAHENPVLAERIARVDAEMMIARMHWDKRIAVR